MRYTWHLERSSLCWVTAVPYVRAGNERLQQEFKILIAFLRAKPADLIEMLTTDETPIE